MPKKIAVAALSGMATGVCITAASVHGISTDEYIGLALFAALSFFPLIIVILIATASERRWRREQEERNQRSSDALAGQRRMFNAEFVRRSAELREREARLNRHSESNQAAVQSLASQLAETREALVKSLDVQERVEADYESLAAEYNGLILATLDERTQAFKRRAAPTVRYTGVLGRQRDRPPVTGNVARLYVDPPAEPKDEREHEHARPAEG